MDISRRSFLQIGTAGMATAALCRHAAIASALRQGVKFKVGAPDWNLKLTAKLEAIAFAKRLGFDGVQVSIGRKMELQDRSTRKAYLAESRRVGLPLTSVCLDILHVNGLKSDPLGQRWVGEAIPIAKDLGVKVILVPFFGKWALQTTPEMDFVGDALRELGAGGRKGGCHPGARGHDLGERQRQNSWRGASRRRC